MKRSFIPLLLASLIILTSMSECDFKKSFSPYRWEDSYVSAEVNGESYISTPGEVLHLSMFAPTVRLDESETGDDGFLFLLNREIFSQEDTVYVRIRYENFGNVELNRRYELPGESDNSAKLSVASPQNVGLTSYYDFDATDGYFMITEKQGGLFAGIFEFNAYCPELDETVSVTNGTFRFDGYESY